MTTVAVVGSGAWGTALACHAARRGNGVRMWALEPDVADEINARRRNSLYLPDVELPDGIQARSDAAEVVRQADVVILVPPSTHLRAVSTALAHSIAANALVVVATKGFEPVTLALMSEVLAETMPDVRADRLTFLSGPSFAREVAAGLHTDVVVASEGMVAARAIQPLLHSSMFRVYTSDDPVGVQVGGAVKNVIAIATGACDGLGLGANARAALITRGLAEMTRLGVALGADPLTFLGLAGVGDLVLTCTGDLSRNRTLGRKLAEGIDPQSYLAEHRSVAEGFFTSSAAYELSRTRNVEMPIAEQVFHVLHRGRPLRDAVQRLVTREFKHELYGIPRDGG